MNFTIIKQSLKFVLLMTIVTGILYPLAVTGISQLFFKKQANGSIIYQNEKAVASKFIGQEFSELKYFWSRPSATGPNQYNGAASSGSNKTPTGAELEKTIADRIDNLKKYHNLKDTKIPVDLLTASGSGLDPHISVAAAYFQIDRVAKERNLSVEILKKIVDKYTEKRQFGILGEPRVNVVKLNLALDTL